jgi:hypothetical protein
VQSTKESAKDARDEAASVTAAVIEAISTVNSVSRSDVTTTDVSVHPQINWDNGRQTIIGYTFNQRLQVGRPAWHLGPVGPNLTLGKQAWRSEMCFTYSFPDKCV